MDTYNESKIKNIIKTIEEMSLEDFLKELPSHLEQKYFLLFVFEVLFPLVREKHYDSQGFKEKILYIFEMKIDDSFHKSSLIMILNNYKSRGVKWTFGEFILQRFINSELDALKEKNYFFEFHINNMDSYNYFLKLKSNFYLTYLEVLQYANFNRRKEIFQLLKKLYGNFITDKVIKTKYELNILKTICEKFQIFDIENIDLFTLEDVKDEKIFDLRNNRMSVNNYDKYSFITSYLRLLPELLYSQKLSQIEKENILKNLKNYFINYSKEIVDMIDYRVNQLNLNPLKSSKNLEIKEEMEYLTSNENLDSDYLNEGSLATNLNSKFSSEGHCNLYSYYLKKKNNKITEENFKDYLPCYFLNFNANRIVVRAMKRNWYIKLFSDLMSKELDQNYKVYPCIQFVNIFQNKVNICGLLNSLIQEAFYVKTDAQNIDQSTISGLKGISKQFYNGDNIFLKDYLEKLIILKKLYKEVSIDTLEKGLIDKLDAIESFVKNFKTIDEIEEWLIKIFKNNKDILIYNNNDNFDFDVQTKFPRYKLPYSGEENDFVKTANNYNFSKKSDHTQFDKSYNVSDNNIFNEYLLADYLNGSRFLYCFKNKSVIFTLVENILKENNINFESKINDFPYIHDFRINHNGKEFFFNIVSEEKCFLGTYNNLIMVEETKNLNYNNKILWFDPKGYNYSKNFYDNDVLKLINDFTLSE